MRLGQGRDDGRATGTGRLALVLSTASWRALLTPALIALASRVYSSVLIILADASSRATIPTPFTWWDAGWYLEVATHGYHPTSFTSATTVGRYDFAFFPLWPGLMRVAAVLSPDPLVPVLLANLLFVIAAVLLWRLLADRFGTAVASGAVALLAFSPPSFAFSMAYSEPLFRALAAAYFLGRSATGRRALGGPLAAALAMAARIDGAAIVASAALGAVRRRGAERRTAVLAVLAGCAVFAAWWLFIALLVHDPLGFLRASPSWYRTAGWEQYVAALRHPSIRNDGRLLFAAVMLAGSLLALRRDRELGVYALAALAIGLLPGGVIYSLPRYAVIAFPAYAGLSRALGRRGTVALVVAFALAQWLFVSWAFALPGAQPP